ncbi:MAG: ATP-dependent DNA helicase RecG [Pseudomonadota bacterium]|nr:ATP-dependent DNA helicase RecG [Pseudomonadota bacterium]
MRPEILYPLFAPVIKLPGIGPRTGKLVEKLAGPQIVDLLWHLPSGLIDRRFAPKIADAPDGAIATITIQILAHQPAHNRRMPYRVLCSDDTGPMNLVFFHAKPDYLAKQLPVGETRVVSGKIEHYDGVAQMTHPDHIGKLENIAELQTVDPVYPLTAGLTPKPLGRAITAAIKLAPDLAEWNDPAWLARQDWPGWRDALAGAHAPGSEDDLSVLTPARARLAYDELLANQLALLLVRLRQRRMPGRVIDGDGRLRDEAIAALPYDLTGSQWEALGEIIADMGSSSRMLRLLQGDVGSGKTVVAFLALLNAVECGAQAAIMAPTEILARQHLATIQPLAEAVGVRAEILTGRDKGKSRQAILDGFGSGEISIAIGTHALFQEDVAFHDLALAVIDEQHRFGVHQRLSLTGKGETIDMLVMTATPIPRTLMLTAYGDLDVSRLIDKPPGRQPIDTRALPLERLEDVAGGLRRAIADGGRIYWVCPLVEDSEISDMAAATSRQAALAQRFGDRVGLVHGRMKGKEKDEVMARFASGALDILVATTVIEVGVDVPEATVMVIEHAERFGLSQLHQLRGRVGRGTRASSCLLLYAQPLGETARARIKVMRETDDGFRIAEEDLRLRGAGELLGTRQSGLPEFRIADIAAHGNLLAAARDDARLIIERDPDLASARGEALRTLLYLFERDAVVPTGRSG